MAHTRIRKFNTKDTYPEQKLDNDLCQAVVAGNTVYLRGQICVTPDFAAFHHPEAGAWLEKFYTVNEDWVADDRRRLLAFARDLLNSDYAGHRLTFQLFAQSAPFAHLAAVYRNFDWDGSLDFVRKSAGLSDKVMGKLKRAPGDSAVVKWFDGSKKAAQ